MSCSKRLFDLLFASLALIIFSPVLLVIALLVRVFIGRPVLFKQQRSGYRGRPFLIYKFRSMTDRHAPDGNLLADAARLTRFGSFLRSLSLDELPELLNILKGEMSIVGPRPLIMDYLPLYSAEQARRHDVMPGLTGWAQVNGRNAIDWPTRFELDTWYVDHRSLWLDVRIIFLTIGKVVTRKDITQPGQATMENFQGNAGDQD